MELASKHMERYLKMNMPSARDGYAIFKFQDETTCLRVLNRPWHYNHKPMLLRKWAHGVQLKDLFDDHLELWVKFFGVPIDLLSGEGLSHVVSSIGIPLQVDTQAIEEGRLSFINVLMKIDPNKPRQEQVKVLMPNGLEVSVRVVYQDQLVVCDACKRSGHIRAYCRSTKPSRDSLARGRSRNRRPVQRGRSEPENGSKQIAKTRAVWVEKTKTNLENGVNDIQVPLQPNTDPEMNKNTTILHELNQDKDMSNSDQEVDSLVWMEVQTRRKKKSKKKKKSDSKQAPKIQNKVVKDSSLECFSAKGIGETLGAAVGKPESDGVLLERRQEDQLALNNGILPSTSLEPQDRGNLVIEGNTLAIPSEGMMGKEVSNGCNGDVNPIASS